MSSKPVGTGTAGDIPVSPDRRVAYVALPPKGKAHATYVVPAVTPAPRSKGR